MLNMTKSKLHKKKLLPLCIVLTLLILGIFNLNSVYAINWSGDGALFIPDDDHPTQYGVFIQQPNMFTTMSIDASNQGNFTMMDWEGGLIENELVDYPGQDISELYPWYFDDYLMNSVTNNNFTNPWTIDWMNVTTLNPHDIDLSNYTLNSVFNYHVMTENSVLNIPLNSTIPMQIDLMIDSVGPKILKLDWLTDDPDLAPLVGLAIISPSGKVINMDSGQVEYQVMVGTPMPLYNYYSFVAHEKGAYRLLAQAGYGMPTQLSMEFLDTPISTLSSDTLTYGGHDNDNPTAQDAMDLEWKNQWYRINGEQGDLYRLDLGLDFGGGFPAVNLWTPCENGYQWQVLGVGAFVY